MKTTVVWMTVLAAVSWALGASAGSIEIRDNAGFIPPSDVVRLRADQASWPFDVHVLAEVVDTRDTLEDDAHRAVTNPQVVVLAVDPTHHRTVVRFGNETGVKSGDYDSIAQAGGAHFRAHEVADGFEAMITRVRASREAARAISTSSTPVIVQEGLSGGTWWLIALSFACFAGLAVWLYRRSKRDREVFSAALDENRLETAELRSRNVEEMLYDDTGVRAHAPRPVTAMRSGRVAGAPMPSPVVSSPVITSPVIVNNTGGNDLLTGMLIGEELNRPRVVERVVEREERSRSEDSGGSSSSWDSGSSVSSSSSSDDSGGASSSYDSGGSSDFGSSGGGFDGGGGGSDW
jgi:hypothetical protein